MTGLTKTAVNHFKRAYFNFKRVVLSSRLRFNYRLQNTIVLTGAPRSGTTWLGELLNTIPHSVIIFEPLHIRRVSEAKLAGFDWMTYLDPGQKNPLAYDYMDKVLRGQVITKWTAREIKKLSIQECLKADTLIIKFVRANMILDWMVNSFPIRRPILMLRHPCAVVASQIRREWKDRVSLENLMASPIFKLYPYLLSKVNGLETVEEYLAVKWCLDYFHPLLNTGNYELVIYEKLVSDGTEQIKRIFKKLGYAIPEKSFSQLKIPSMTSYDGNPWNEDDPLSRWKKYLSREQIMQIMEVVKRFGMDFYSEDIEPDYRRIYQEGPPIKV